MPENMTAASQYANRPPDERFTSMGDMIADAQDDKNRSAERAYNLKDLHVRPIGDTGQDLELVSPRGAGRFTHWSFGQLARTLKAPAGYLRQLPAALAADNLNHGLASSPAGTDANLLVRAANGQEPTIRACTSDTYGRLWDGPLYQATEDQLSRRGGGEFKLPTTWEGKPAGAYRGDRDSFLLLVNGGSIVEDPSLRGEDRPMYKGVMIRNSEVGYTSVTIDSILFRYICGNHILWGAVTDRRFRRRHVGKHVLRDVAREIGRVAYQWTTASVERDQAVIKALTRYEVAHTRDAIIDELHKMGATKSDAAAAYDACERTESVSPRSYWGLVQGLTRISQETPYQDERLVLDRLAGVVLARGAKVAA